MDSGEVQEVIILGVNYSNVVRNILAVPLPSGYVKIWMPGDLLYGQDDVVLLLSVGGSVPLPTQNLHISPRHLHSPGIPATVSAVSADVRTHVRTAAVGEDVSLLRLTEEGAVSAGYQDCRARGSGE